MSDKPVSGCHGPCDGHVPCVLFKGRFLREFKKNTLNFRVLFDAVETVLIGCHSIHFRHVDGTVSDWMSIDSHLSDVLTCMCKMFEVRCAQPRCVASAAMCWLVSLRETQMLCNQSELR